MDINLIELFEKFNSEDRCRELLETAALALWRLLLALRKRLSIEARKAPPIRVQRMPLSVLSRPPGSVFHDSHLPLWKWFLATYLICEGKKGISAQPATPHDWASRIKPRGISAIASVKP